MCISKGVRQTGRVVVAQRGWSPTLQNNKSFYFSPTGKPIFERLDDSLGRVLVDAEHVR